MIDIDPPIRPKPLQLQADAKIKSRVRVNQAPEQPVQTILALEKWKLQRQARHKGLLLMKGYTSNGCTGGMHGIFAL